MTHILYLSTIIVIFAAFYKARTSLLQVIRQNKELNTTLSKSLKESDTENKSLRWQNETLLKDLAKISHVIDNQYQDKLKQWQDAWIKSNEKKIRKDAIERSRSVIRGQATEHLAPMLMDNLNIKDFRFLGNPVDYIVFSGVSDITDKMSNTIDKIIFLEIKSGSSNLNTVQRRIRDAIKESRIEFVVYNPDTKEIKTTSLEE